MFLFPKIFHLFKRAAADVVSNFMLFYFNLNFLYGIRVRYLIVCRYTKDTFYNISITIPITIMNHFEVLKKLKMVHDISIIIEIVEKKTHSYYYCSITNVSGSQNHRPSLFELASRGQSSGDRVRIGLYGHNNGSLGRAHRSCHGIRTYAGHLCRIYCQYFDQSH